MGGPRVSSPRPLAAPAASDVTPGDNASAPQLSPGDLLRYRALHVGDYRAVVRAVRLNGMLDIEVDPGGGDPLALSRIAFYESADECPAGACFRKI